MNHDIHPNPDESWKQRWHMPQINWSQIASGNHNRGLVSSTQTGKFQLHAWDVQTGSLQQLTDSPTGKRWGSISPDGQWVYYLQDTNGNEIGHYVRVSFDGSTIEDITPDLPDYSTYGLAFSQSGNYLGISIVDSSGFHVYGVPVDGEGRLGQRRLIYQTSQMAFDPTFSFDGEIVVIASTELTGKPQYALLAYDLRQHQSIAQLWDGEGSNMRSVAFSPLPDDMRLLGSSTSSGAERPFIWNPTTGERANLELSENSGDWAPVDWATDASTVLLCQTNKATQQLWLYEVASHHASKLNHPSGFYETSKGRGTYFHSPTQIFAGWEDAGHPPQVIELDARSGMFQRDILVASKSIPGQSLRSIEFVSSDGQLVQGWLGVPEGSGPFPTVIYLHGGPEFVVMNWFDAESQAWIDHGFAFLTINYRGSTTFGRDFQEKIWGNQGYWEVEDIVAARNWLFQVGISDPGKVFLSGWSYGGYLTLLALGKRPALWAGGMAGNAIADWSANYDDAADTLRSYIALAFNGTPADKPDLYARSSPITYAENVSAPVLIIQGRNDTRTPSRQIEEYEARLKHLGKQIAVHWYDAGHTVGDVALLVAHTAMMIDFARDIANSDQQI